MIDERLLAASLPTITRAAKYAARRLAHSIDAEDAAQEICLQLLKTRRTVNSDNIKTLVYDYTRNIIAKHAKRQAKCKFVPMFEIPHEEDMTSAEIKLFLDTLGEREKITAFLLIAGLSIRHMRRQGQRLERPLQRIRDQWRRMYA